MSAPETLPSAEEDGFTVFLESIMGMTADKLIKLYLKTREAKAQASRAYDEQEAKYKAIMQRVENALLAVADANGVEQVKTELGTAFTAEEKKISIADDTAFEAFLNTLPDDGDRYGFFERRVSSRRVEDYMKKHEGAIPPGLNVFRNRTMRVRKSSGKE